MSDPEPIPAWWIVGPGEQAPNGGLERLPEAPPWRTFAEQPDDEAAGGDARAQCGPIENRGAGFKLELKQYDIINAAICLRRPLLVRGKPGVGKTMLAYHIARQLGLPRVLRWSITSRTQLNDGLYQYDAIARLQAASLTRHNAPDAPPPPIEQFMKLGPLGTAFATSKFRHPRVLLIDELDKSDIDLPNDLLHIFEEGEFEVPELERETGQPQTRESEPGQPGNRADNRTLCLRVQGHHEEAPVSVRDGKVRCRDFPIVIMTTNDERDFPPAFLRRCLELDIEPPDKKALVEIVKSHLGLAVDAELDAGYRDIIDAFHSRREAGDNELPTDRLLHAIFLAWKHVNIDQRIDQRIKQGEALNDKDALIDCLWRPKIS
jgi:MoxR-like ATPase